MSSGEKEYYINTEYDGVTIKGSVLISDLGYVINMESPIELPDQNFLMLPMKGNTMDNPDFIDSVIEESKSFMIGIYLDYNNLKDWKNEIISKYEKTKAKIENLEKKKEMTGEELVELNEVKEHRLDIYKELLDKGEITEEDYQRKINYVNHHFSRNMYERKRDREIDDSISEEIDTFNQMLKDDYGFSVLDYVFVPKILEIMKKNEKEARYDNA